VTIYHALESSSDSISSDTGGGFSVIVGVMSYLTNSTSQVSVPEDRFTACSGGSSMFKTPFDQPSRHSVYLHLTDLQRRSIGGLDKTIQKGHPCSISC